MTIRAISYGGGVDSTALLVLAAERVLDLPLVLFSNVGDDSEHPATLAYVRDHARPYAEAHGLEFLEIRKRPKGTEKTLYQTITEPGSRTIGIPARLQPSGAPVQRSCTVTFKIARIVAILKQRGASPSSPALTALGIDYDELERMRNAGVLLSPEGLPVEDPTCGTVWRTRDAFQHLAYPLVHLKLGRGGCEEVIRRAGLPIPPKSSCWFCPFHSPAHWQKMRRKEPALFAKSVALEETLRARSVALGRGEVYFTRFGLPLDRAIRDSGQLDLFPESEEDAPSCDVGGYCHS